VDLLGREIDGQNLAFGWLTREPDDQAWFTGCGQVSVDQSFRTKRLDEIDSKRQPVPVNADMFRPYTNYKGCSIGPISSSVHETQDWARL
jgi:hypothetical protein